MNRILANNLFRGLTLPSLRLSRLFTPVLLAALALAVFWAAPALADDVKVETIPLYGGQIKYTFWLMGDRVIYHDILNKNNDGTSHRDSLEYDENGYKKTESEIKYDKDGKIILSHMTQYSYYPDGRLKEVKFSSSSPGDSYRDTYEYDDGNVTITRDKSGQTEPPRQAKAEEVQPAKDLNPFGKEYKKVKALAEEAKRRGAYLGPQAAPSTPAVPGVPAAPGLPAQQIKLLPGGGLIKGGKTIDGGRYEIVYDNQGRVVRIDVYDPKGREIRHVHFKVSQDGKTSLRTVQTDFGYDAQGHQYRKDDVLDTYDKDERLIKTETTNYDTDGHETSREVVKNIYSKEGVLLRTETATLDSGNLEVRREQVTYIYTRSDLKIQLPRQVPDHVKDKWNLSRTKREVIIFNPDGSKVIKYQIFVKEINQWETVGEFQEPPGAPKPGMTMAKPAPATPAAPASYAASATPRWLRGAYVSANLGVGFTSPVSFNPSFRENFTGSRERDDQVDYFPVTSAGSLSFPGNINPSLVGGLKIGRYGCCFSDASFWDYLGWCFDISYQRYSLSQQSGSFQRTTWVNGDLFSQGTGAAILQGDGSLFTLAFLVNARYGFLPTPENPFGTLQPYVGVGPALVVNRLDPKIMFTRFNDNAANGALDFSGETSVNVGLAAEAGLRYYPVQHVFLDLSYRFLHSRPDFTFTSNTGAMKFPGGINNSTLRFGVGYAF